MRLSLSLGRRYVLDGEHLDDEQADGLDEHGAPRVHETNTAGQVELGFVPSTPWSHTDTLEPDSAARGEGAVRGADDAVTVGPAR